MANKKVQLHNSAGDNLYPRISVEQVYPVGAIYLSTVSTDPGTLFGGTWTRIKDQFLLAAGDVYAAGTSGGEATHTLTTDEIPSHRHTGLNNDAYNVSGASSAGAGFVLGNATYHSTALIGLTGGGKAHNNMPPYLTVYAWRRTA